MVFHFEDGYTYLNELRAATPTSYEEHSMIDYVRSEIKAKGRKAAFLSIGAVYIPMAVYFS